MANFRTHITVAAAGGALLACAGYQLQGWPPLQALAACALTAFGGILPDIDADHSRSSRLIFTILAIPALVVGGVLLQPWLTPGALLLACGGIYIGVRYVGGTLFSRFTVHRGGWHSLLAATLCTWAVAALSFHWLAQPGWLAWVHGLAVLAGFLIHLMLDEIYSVDVAGGRLKRSFGTALKPFDLHRPVASLLMLAATAALLPWLPPWEALEALLV
ncbi:metal-dependent hydrolase [Halomonas garicola]|uniref:metal-dependent hydrolase n=1 Tax=Halomonas garicola TaxID=1690008 RepID=UPI00289B0801|nr:metal-dependent hydrolase [Halomonas garicola]